MELRSDDSFLFLNVGGKPIVVSRELLLRYKSSVLATMFSSSIPASKLDKSGAFVIDRDPRYFRAMLNFLRTGLVERSSSIDPELLREEAQYWGIEQLETALREKKADFGSRSEFVKHTVGMTRENGLIGARLNGLDLSNMHLENLKDLQKTNLSGASLCGANIEGCLFSKCEAKRTNFDGVKANGSNFQQSSMEGASFVQATLTGAVFSSCNLEGAKFENAQMSLAILQKANLMGVSFHSATLSDAHFQDSNCQGSDFTGVKGLDSIHFGDADLRGAILDWSKLGDAHWVRGARVTPEQYEKIKRDDKAQLKLRIISDVQDESPMKEIQEIVSKYDLVLYILGYGSLSGGEHYCQKAVKLAKEHFQDSSIHIVDVVGQPKLIDDLQYCCNKRPWPLIFYQGKYIGGYSSLKQMVRNKEDAE